MLIAHYTLLLGVLFSFLTNKKNTLSIACIFFICSSAVIQEIITPFGFLLILTFLAIANFYFYGEFENKKAKIALDLVFIGFLYSFAKHKLPGFENTLILDRINVSELSSFYSMRINFDKIIVALIIFSFLNHTNISVNKLKNTLVITLACIACILIPAFFFNYVKFDPKIPNISLLWMINNLFFVCFSEEVIFRGYAQEFIRKKIHTKNHILPILASSVIFGLYHDDSGIILMIFSAICGLFYGYAYYKTKSIVCSMLVHFLLNFCHFFLFTYPSVIKI